MTKSIGIGFLIVCAAGFSPIAASYTASPSLNSQCGYSLVTPRNGAGVIFDESCTIAYVYPPLLGTAEFAGLAQTTNIQFCPSLKNVNQIADRTFNSMKILSQKVEAMISGFEPLEKELVDLKSDLLSAKVKMESAKHRLEKAETQIQTMRESIREARKTYEKCIEDQSAAHCIDLKSLWDEAKNELNKFRNIEYEQLQAIAYDTAEQYDLSSSKFSAYRNRYTDAIAPMLEIQDRLMQLNLKTMELYQEYTKLEGATGQIIWSVPWDTVLEDYRRLNPSLRVNWSRLPIKSAELISTIKNQETQIELSNISALKSAMIPGAKITGFAGMGMGEKVDGVQSAPSGTHGASIVFGNSISGQIVLTLAGACPYFNGIGDRSNVNINDLAKTVVANLIYTHELAVRRSYTATYNLSELLNKIEQKTQRGGLFSTASTHSLIEDNDSSSWFSIKFNSNSSEFNYSDEEQKEITRELKEELMDKAMMQFAILYAGSATPPAVPDFVESGATLASRELRRCWHYYCQAASAVLGVANSIFGRSNAVANFHRNNNSWSSDHVNGIQFVDRSGTLTFRPE